MERQNPEISILTRKSLFDVTSGINVQRNPILKLLERSNTNTKIRSNWNVCILPVEGMEYLENTMETLVFYISIYGKWLGTKPQTSIVTLMKLSRVVLKAKNAIFNVQNSRYTTDNTAVIVFILCLKFLQLPFSSVEVVVLWSKFILGLPKFSMKINFIGSSDGLAPHRRYFRANDDPNHWRIYT